MTWLTNVLLLGVSMITEIIVYNSMVFAIFAIACVLIGIVYAWQPKIAVCVVGVLAIVAIFAAISALGTGEIADEPLHCMIGGFVGGMTWRTWFDAGKDIYNNMVID